MSDLLDLFNDEMNNTYSIYPKAAGMDVQGEYQEGFESSPTLTDIQCAFYTGSFAESLMEDRYKTKGTGIVISKVQSVPDGAKLVLGTGEEFSVIHADDVMLQGEVLVITVGTPDYGESI